MHDMSQKVKKALHNASQDEWEKKSATVQCFGCVKFWHDARKNQSEKPNNCYIERAA